MRQKPDSNHYEITIQNRIAEIRRIALVIEQLAPLWDIPLKTAMDLNLALEEVVTNILFYAFDDNNEHLIRIVFEKENRKLLVEVIDEGKPFNLLKQEQIIDVRSPLEDRKIGGLGIHLLKNLMDEISYNRNANCNHVYLTKKY